MIKSFYYLAGLIILAALIRLDLLIANNFVIDSDEAIVGLMAKHFLDGRPMPTFYYGQHYMGSFEAYFAALFFKLGGINSVALKITPFFFSLVLVLQVYALGKRVSGEFVGRVASLLTALPASPLVVWSSMARGGFIEIVCIAVLVLDLSVIYLQSAKFSPKLLFTIGLFTGLGWWVNNQIIYVFPVVFFSVFSTLIYRDRKLSYFLTAPLFGLLGFLIGGVQFWIYNLKNKMISFEIFNSSPKLFWNQLVDTFTISLPILLGAKRFWTDEDIFPAATSIVSIFALLSLLWILLRRSRELVQLSKFRFNREEPLELLIIFLGFMLFVFAYSSFGHLVTAPRYLLPIYPAIFILLAWLIKDLTRRFKILGFIPLVLLIFVHLFSSYWQARYLPGEPVVYNGERVQKSHQELINWLKNNSVKAVKTNYWIGYRLAFETLESIRFSVYQAPENIRISEYEEFVQTIPESEVPYILTPAQAALISRALRLSGYDFHPAKLSGYIVIHQVRNILKEQTNINLNSISVSASHNSSLASLAIDRNLDTRWGSGHPQRSDMWFELSLLKPQILRGFKLQTGKWRTDQAKSLKVIAYDSLGKVHTVIEPSDNKAIYYFIQGRGEFFIKLPQIEISKITLLQSGRDSIYDWSIAELSLFQ